MSSNLAHRPTDDASGPHAVALGVVEGGPHRDQRMRAILHDLRGWMWLALLRVRHRRLARDLEPFAAHLAEELLPTFRRHGEARLALTIDPTPDAQRVIAYGAHVNFDLPAPPRLVSRLAESGLTEIRLDTRLGTTEIVESLLVAVHAAPELRGRGAAPADVPDEPRAHAWRASYVGDAARTATGFQGLTTRLRHDARDGVTEILHSPRDLFASRSLARWVMRRTAARDARSMLRISTKAGLLAFLILMIPLLSFTWDSVAGWIIWLACALTIAVWISVTVSTLGSVLYDRERRDELLKSYVKQIQRLSDFAAASPSPIIEIGRAGEVVQMNPAMKELLRTLGLPESRAHEALPGNLDARIRRALRGRESSTSTTVGGRTLHYTFRPTGERTIVAACVDITSLHTRYGALRAANADLEARIEARARQTQEATVLCLARLAEIRDPETGRHLERTKRYVGLLARTLAARARYRDALDEATIELLVDAAPLHDIGKVGVPDSILFKPARLAPEERAEMQKHPLYGGDALAWVSERLGESRFFEVGKEIAYFHHERWDGTGYPRGLAGEEIPLGARLMALADVYDALMSPRVYRPALPHAEVRELILEERGKHFDPDVVDAFLACEDTFAEIAQTELDDSPIIPPEEPGVAGDDAGRRAGAKGRDGISAASPGRAT